MGITEKTTIQELLCDQHISSTTYDILDTARLETVEMILQYTDYAQNFPKLFGISGLLCQNYKELQDIIFPLVQKQNEATKLRVKGYPNNTCFVKTNTTIEELSENLLIPSDILPYFREIGIETFQDILDFKTESNVYKKYIKIRFGEDVFAKLASAMRICQKAYVNSKKEQKKTNSTNQVQVENKGKNTMLGIKDLDNPCYAFDANTQKENFDVTSNTFGATSKVNTIKNQNAIEHQIDEFPSIRDNCKIEKCSIVQTDKRRIYNSIEEMFNKVSLEEIHDVELLSREDLDLLKKSGFKSFKYVKEFSNLSISSKTFLKTQLSFDEYWRIVDLVNDFNKQSFIDKIIKALWYHPKNHAIETEEISDFKQYEENGCSLSINNETYSKVQKIGTLHIFLTTTIEELYEKKVISCETYNALNSIKIHSYSDILSLSKKFKDFNELSLCANFSKLSISEIKELGNYYHGLKDVHCEKATFDEKKSVVKLIEKNEKLHEGEEAISVKDGESSEQVKSVNEPKNISPSIKEKSLEAEEELPSLSVMPTTQNTDNISYKSEFDEEAIFNNTFNEPEKNDIEALDATYNTCYTYDASKHPIFHKILSERGLAIPTNPIWKMNITPQEQHLLEECLHQAYLKDNLSAVGEEAALYYAIWWQRSYSGGSPSSEAVAQSANIPQEYSDDLYKSARLAYKRWGFRFLHDSKYHYFRSLLMQGGLPINHVVTNKGNFNGYKEFLRSLVHEVSNINAAFNAEMIPSMSCISYLPKSFKNNGIYEISMQIAHAIIEDREDMLPYDSNKDGELKELTRSLRKTATLAKKEQHFKPLSFIWEAQIKDKELQLYYYLHNTANVCSRNIPGLNPADTFSFDIFISQQYVATYKRIKLEENEYGEKVGVFHRMNFDQRRFLWEGESYIELKLITNEGDSLFINALNCYPQDFSVPQQFQKVNDTYVQQTGRKAEENVIFVDETWQEIEGKKPSSTLQLHHKTIYSYEFTDSIELCHIINDEHLTFTNVFTKYAVEFGGIFIGWLEKSNYKLLNKIPYITVYDESNQILNANQYDTEFRLKVDSQWRNLTRNTILPYGLIEIKITFPDNHCLIETFYSIGSMSFETSKETMSFAEIACRFCGGLVGIQKNESINIKDLSENKWSISRLENSSLLPTIEFNIFKKGMPTLKVEIPTPFIGIAVVDSQNKPVRNGEILSVDNLTNYRIIMYGRRDKKYNICYINQEGEESEVKIKGNISEGITPMSNFEESIRRIYALYVDDYTDSNSYILFSMNGINLKIRRYVYNIEITDLIFRKCLKISHLDIEQNETYKGTLKYVLYGQNLSPNDIMVNLLGEENEKTKFVPDNNNIATAVIVFSDKFDEKKVIPKVINYDNDNNIVTNWQICLESERLDSGIHWQSVIRYFEIASEYHLPFKAFGCFNDIVIVPSLLTRFILSMFLAGKTELFTSEVSRFEEEFAIGIHWIKQEDWQKAIDCIFDLYPNANMAMTLMPVFMQYLQEMLSTTLDSDYTDDVKKFISGEFTEESDKFNRIEVTELRARAVGKNDNNEDLPFIGINLKRKYLMPNAYIGTTGYQFCLLNSPIKVAEYAFGIGSDIWTDTSEHCMEVRRVINFYRMYFTTMYSQIFVRALKILNKKYNGLR